MEKQFWDRIIFKDISEKSKKAIENMKGKRECSYHANELIISENEDIKDICVILDGVLKSTEYTSGGKELNSSYFFGEQMKSAYYTGAEAFPFYLVYSGTKKYFFNTYALKKSRVVWLPVDELMPIIEEDKQFMYNILKFVSFYTCYCKKILRLLQYRKIEERLAYYIIYLNESIEQIEIPNSQEVLADILHVSRTSLNQELVRLKKEGIIDMDKKYIVIFNREYLENIL